MKTLFHPSQIVYHQENNKYWEGCKEMNLYILLLGM